ncbi:cell division protein SepF [Actinocrinis puniceicyclus]|uniref:Cell division protein SepF n=1 Tax=Actinocrinis puniceicyclus TaxID=977794 RepID=A0A8J7WKM9_9ACTN|nr:cell division protein SepF [Actinocrinis puniceicyclus]MBS2964066.1 cell division protein SepF [Actinocrinis puniceicyclus]
MPGFMKKTAVYLGLMEGDDPYAYEEYGQEADEERPLHLDDDEEEEPERYSASRTESAAAEQESRPLFLSEPRRPRDAERTPERREVDRRDAGDSAFHGAQSAGYPVARPAPIALLPERADRYERPAPVAATMGSVGHGFGGGGDGGSSSDAYRITTLHPRTYNEARTIGEHFRDGTPVIMNLTEMGDADAKRLVDFAAGLVFGLRGSIERVTQKVFLLSPANVDVTAEDKARIAEGGFFNQS